MHNFILFQLEMLSQSRNVLRSAVCLLTECGHFIPSQYAVIPNCPLPGKGNEATKLYFSTAVEKSEVNNMAVL